MAVSPSVPARYRLPFLALARPLRAPDWVVQRGAAAPGDQVAAGGEPAHVHAGLGDGILGSAPGPAGHRLGLLELFLIRGQQVFDHFGQGADVGGDPVDAFQHGLEQGGVGVGEEFSAFQGLFQLDDLATDGGAGQLGQHLRVAFPGDQVVHDVPACHPVQV